MSSYDPSYQESANSLVHQADIDRLFEEYLPKLVRVAEARISERFKGKFDENDIVGTVFRSVFRRWKEGKFKFDDDAEFWRLLVTVAKRKIYNKVRDYKTKIRSIDLEVADAASAIVAAPDPDPADAAAFEESLAILGERLNQQEKEIFKLRMEGREYMEIADLLDISERHVRRKIVVIRERLKGLFDSVPE
jgi:RNA polymerase sigma factor (sigma-70 family)